VPSTSTSTSTSLLFDKTLYGSIVLVNTSNLTITVNNYLTANPIVDGDWFILKCVTVSSPVTLTLVTTSNTMTDGTNRTLTGTTSTYVLNATASQSPNDAMWIVYYDASGNIQSGSILQNKLYLY
jgi:hypothetical protein